MPAKDPKCSCGGDVLWQTVPHSWSSNCEGSGANSGQSGWWCHETVGGSRAQGLSTWQVSNADKWAEICGSSSMKHFVRQHG